MKKILLFLSAFIFLLFFISSKNSANALTCGQDPLTGSFCATSQACNQVNGRVITGVSPACSNGGVCCQGDTCQNTCPSNYECGTFVNNCGQTITCTSICNLTSQTCNQSTNKCANNPETCSNQSNQYCFPKSTGCDTGDVAGSGTCSDTRDTCCKVVQQAGGGYDCGTSGCAAHTGSGTGTYSSVATCNRDCTTGINGGQCPVCPQPDTSDPTSEFYYGWLPSTQKCENGKGGVENPTFATCPSGQYCFNGQGCGFNYSNGPGFQTGQLPCGDPSKGQAGCDTAIGKIQISSQGLVKSFFGVILSITGILAVLLIIISGYRLTASHGNPEAIQHAREQLTAAIVGLLFVILSFTILNLIGISILNLPGQQ